MRFQRPRNPQGQGGQGDDFLISSPGYEKLPLATGASAIRRG